jgi:hypothetical protein
MMPLRKVLHFSHENLKRHFRQLKEELNYKHCSGTVRTPGPKHVVQLNVDSGNRIHAFSLYQTHTDE